MTRSVLAAGGLVVLILAAPVAAQDAAAPRAFTPADWYRVKTVGSPALSPDGSQVAFTVTTVEESENRRRTEVWLVPASGGEPRRLTSPSFSSSNPRWSEDGAILYFSSNRPGARGNTWALRMDQPGEAFQPETPPPSGSRPADGSFVVYTGPARDGDDPDGDDAPGSPDAGRAGGQADGRRDPYASMPAPARPPHGSVTSPLAPARFDGRHYVQLPMKSNTAGYVANPRSEPSEPAVQQIWIRGLGADTARSQITNTAYSHRNARVSPDGRWIAFVADVELRQDSVLRAQRDSLAALPFSMEREAAQRTRNDVYLLSIDGGEPRRLTSVEGAIGSVTWSRDSRRIAFTSRRDRVAQNRLYVVDRDGGEPVDLLGDWQYEPGTVEWLPGGDILMTAAIGGRSGVFRIDTRRGTMREVIGGRRRLSGFSFDEAMARVAYVATSVDRPTELYIADVDGRNERRLTGMNDELNAEIAWSPAERFTYDSFDGLEIEGWLMQPYGYEPGRAYPLVLYIHGGPHSAYGENWFDEFQNIAGAGMWVLYTNPRGSSSYGAAFTYSTRGDWGGEDYLDIMAATDLVARRADVDSTRMGVTGGSYGGFMTAWITTRTDRFRAAQTDRMISNWWSWYGSSDAQGLTEFEFYGTPWENPELYDAVSPIRYADRVRTPTLIVQSEEDHRTPMADAEQWFTALVKNDVPVELVRYPRANHDLSRTGEPWLLVDRLHRLRQWFEYWLAEPEPAAVADEELAAGAGHGP